jgi:hypothetical protein
VIELAPQVRKCRVERADLLHCAAEPGRQDIVCLEIDHAASPTRSGSRDQVTKPFPTEYAREGVPPLACRGLETLGHLVTGSMGVDDGPSSPVPPRRPR